MKSNYLQSLEGWNFDKLGNKVRRWNRIGKQNFYVSEMFTHGELHLQLLKSYDRIVGLIDRKENEVPLVVKLGNWSTITSCQITKFANKNSYPLIEASVFTQQAIDRFQSGLA